jgi:hypothetical protein
MLRVKGPQDVGAGIFFMLIGLCGVYFGRNLVYGTASHMGAGFFPIWVSWILVAFGAVIAMRGIVVAGPGIELPVLRPILVVISVILLFGFLVNWFGLAIAIAILTVVSAYARPNVDLRETVVFAVLLGGIVTIAFVYGLGQPIPPWWGEY